MEQSNISNIVKKALFAVMLALLCLPMIQHKIRFMDLKPLNGAYESAKAPVFSWQDWMEGKYQTEQQIFLNDSIGFREVFIRINNQMQFSFFNQAKANGVIIGKDNYLYEENYILAHLGRDFIGQDQIIAKTKKLQRICDTLKMKGIALIVILAPGKASFYPEYIPDRFELNKHALTNYDVYQNEITKAGLRLLDFHKWFRDMKNSSPYPLFPKTGIHWSKYGELIAADSIINYINSIHQDRPLAKLLIGEVETSKIMRDTDDDIEKGMNLFFNIKDLPMGYPQYEFQQSASNRKTKKVKVLTVADSYYWGIFNFGLSRDVFNDGQFWFYNEQIYPESYESPLNVNDIDIVSEIEKNDVILLLCTDANLYKFAFGFIDLLYEIYFDEKHKPDEKNRDSEVK